MATATELLRVAEHMRANVLHDAVGVSYVAAALALEREAKRLQAAEAQQPKRSWPEGWPPFAVLRRAYEQIQVEPTPSTLWCERHGLPSTRWVVSEVRKEFAHNVSALAAQRPA